MPFCKNCGSPVEGQFCAKCGAPAGGPAPGAYTPPPAQPQQYGSAPAPPPAQAGGLTDNVAGLLCYVAGFITGIIFLAIAPYNQSKFVRFHAWQAILFSGAWFAFWVVEAIIAMILPWSLSIIISLLSFVIWLGGMVIWVLLMVKAYQGQRWKLPIVGDIAEKQA